MVEQQIDQDQSKPEVGSKVLWTVSGLISCQKDSL